MARIGSSDDHSRMKAPEIPIKTWPTNSSQEHMCRSLLARKARPNERIQLSYVCNTAIDRRRHQSSLFMYLNMCIHFNFESFSEKPRINSSPVLFFAHSSIMKKEPRRHQGILLQPVQPLAEMQFFG
jgi:hypothetical protein